MQIDEALAVRRNFLKGVPEMAAKVQESNRVIRSHQIACQGERHSWMPEPLSTAQRERANLILLARLALECGLLDTWRVGQRITTKEAA